MYITLRKTFVKSWKAPSAYFVPKSGHKIDDCKNEVEILRNQLRVAQNENESLKINYEDTLKGSEASYKRSFDLESKLGESKLKEIKINNEMLEKNKIIEELMQTEAGLEDELAKAEGSNKKSKELVKAKEKEIRELKIENATVTSSLVQVQTDMTRVNKEKKDNDKKLKKQNKKEFVEDFKI